MSSARHSSRLAIAGAAGYEKIMRAKRSSSRGGGQSSRPRLRLSAIDWWNELLENFVALDAIAPERYRTGVILILKPIIHGAELATGMADPVRLELLTSIAKKDTAVGLIPGPTGSAEILWHLKFNTPLLARASDVTVMALQTAFHSRLLRSSDFAEQVGMTVK